MPPKPKYTHLSQKNQILKRPGQHIGSTKNSLQTVWLAQTEYDEESQKEVDKIVEQEINYNPGLIHIFYEILGNAQDNYFRSKNTDSPLKKIDVTLDRETGRITVWNDGLWIPSTIHEWEADEEVIDDKDHYEAEIIFGNLNSSSNYHDEDDDNKRIVGGLHGAGAKLTNIFSTDFSSETFDPEHQLKVICKWSDNMNNFKGKVTTLKQKKGYTKISYIADFEKFGIKEYSDDHVAVIKKLCMDCAMITGQKVYFNGALIPVKSLLVYSGYYTNGEKIEFKSDDSIVVLCEKPAYEAGLKQISWVNGINTIRGGVHVDKWKKDIFTPLLEKVKSKYSSGKKNTSLKITVKNLEQYFMIFVNSNLENPEFDGQTKGTLSSPTPQTNIPPSKITTLLKWNFMSDIDETIRLMGMKELSKTDGKKKASVSIPKADDANKAGSAKSSDCTLFITEGDSAKAFAVKGISAIEEGTNWYGVLPVRGKVLNVRKSTAKQINDNKEIAQIKEILGLQHGKDYSDDKTFKELRYGKVRILTDADPDGDHIKGLIINFFQFFFPSLLDRGYICSLRTPIVKAKVGNKVVTFYYLKNFYDWAEKQTGRYTVHYYKGLGTSEDSEIFEIFDNPRNVRFINDKPAKDTINMVFNKEGSNDRKKWLEEYEESEFIYKEKNGEEQVPISEFFDNEMIKFSIYDNERSIPSVVDGFKPSQRKALWAGLKVLNTTKKEKVAQFASDVMKLSSYHHGDTSIQQAIISMAQTFVGANNISVFYEAGQFGTRLAGGSDASAPRYIHTHLHSITRYIFRKEDDPILNYLKEEEKCIEPKFFVPIVPMLLINGCNGIGTGYSTNIPAFNPVDLVEWIRLWLDNEVDSDEPYDNYPELVPWYWGFKGTTERVNDQKYIHYGDYKEVGKDCYEITELPVGVWTDDYKETLNSLKSGQSSSANTKTGYDSMTIAQLKEELGNRELQVSGAKTALVTRLKGFDKENGTKVKKTGTSGQLVSKWEWYGDAWNVNFKVWLKPNVKLDYEDTKFKLTKIINLSNMTAFTPKGGIKKYDTLTDILRTFCQVRFKYYQKRKKYLLIALENKLAEQKSKSQFILDVLDNIEILKQTEDELFQYFEKNGYWKKTDTESNDDSVYNYLTSIPIRTFTKDHYQKLIKIIKEIEAEIVYVKKKTPKEMWHIELDEFVTAYGKWKTAMEYENAQLAKKKIQTFGKKKRA